MGLCLSCGKEVVYKYCNTGCQATYQRQEYISRWLVGKESGTRGKNLLLSKHVVRYIRETMGTQCSVCGWDDRHPDDGSILTEIDHIDGDARNSTLGNLRVLCPNCHSKTSTFRARNRKSHRVR